MLSKDDQGGAIGVVDALRLQAGQPPKPMADGVFGMRLALPFALDHVNVWLLRDGPSWTLVDTGIANDSTKDVWSGLLEDGIDGRPITRLIATHFHPDHMGLAGWLCEKTGAAFWTSQIEWLMARWLVNDNSPSFIDRGRQFDRLAGLEDDQIEARAARGNLYRSRALPPPASHVRIREGAEIMIDGEPWRVLIGRGHAPEMICLFSENRGLLLAADQILQRISPNISVSVGEPDADPLSDFMESLETFRDLPEDTLVLPSHGQAFRGMHARIDELISHHHGRLDAGGRSGG